MPVVSNVAFYTLSQSSLGLYCIYFCEGKKTLYTNGKFSFIPVDSMELALLTQLVHLHGDDVCNLHILRNTLMNLDNGNGGCTCLEVGENADFCLH